jgi:glycerol-1-phosphatase
MDAAIQNAHEEAFAAYGAVRGRLPAPVRVGRVVEVGNLDALADRFDVFVLDAFGVPNEGECAITGVPERVAGAR